MESMDWFSVISGLTMGLALAATCGLRAFLPLFAVSLLAYLGHIELAPSFAWMSEPIALGGLSVAVLLEMAGDKFPFIDHFLDATAVVIKPLAAMVATASVMTDFDPMLTAIIGLILGGSMAQGVHLIKANLRLMSSALTATIANPLMSVFEDLLAIFATIMAFLLPVLVFALAAAASVWGFRVWRRRRIQSTLSD